MSEPMTPMRKYGARLQVLSQKGEAVLRLAVTNEGAMVLAGQIAAVWDRHYGERAPVKTATQWKRLLAPAVAEGRILTVRRGNLLYFGLNNHPGYGLPERPLRRFGQERLKMSAQTMRAIETAVASCDRMVTATEICTTWETLYASPAPEIVRRRTLRVLEPAFALGQLRVASRLTRVLQFAPVDRMDAVPHEYLSDLERADEALRRAIERMRSAVLLEEVASEIKRDSALTLQSQAATLAHHLGNLVGWGRAVLVHTANRQARCRNYYSLPWGPRWVLPAAEYHLDRRLAAARALWRASHGRAFTTTALRKFANCRERYHTPVDPPYAWVNALQYLEREGYLVKITSEDAYHVRWAPAAEWNALSSHEQRRALVDHARQFLATEPGSPADGVSPIDTGFISRAQNMRSLVYCAKSALLIEEREESRRRILRARPVTLAQIARAAERHPHLSPRTGVALRTCLTDAARVRNGQRTSAVTCVGVVRNRAFYDTHPSDNGEAYVAFLQALRDAGISPFRRSFRELRTAAELHANGIVPLTNAILDARISSLLNRIQDKRSQLLLSVARAPLLEEENTAAVEAADMLASLETEVRSIRTSQETQTHGGEPEQPLDVEEALNALESLYTIRPDVPGRVLAARFALVPVLREPTTRSASGIGRPIELYFDRVRFVSYAISRWGSSRAAHFAAQGIHALGDLRDPRPFIQALEPESMVSAHAAAAAALGVLDSADARDALARYIGRALERVSDTCAPGTSLPACEAAIYGLAPLAFGALAKELRQEERDALICATHPHVDVRLRWIAQRILHAWDDDWSRNRLLYL